MNRNNQFIKNTIILFIGKIATQFISFFLLPLYTRYLLTNDYGLVDLIQTYILLFVPVLTLRLDSAIFRFLIDKKEDKNEKQITITNVIFLLITEFIIVGLVSCILLLIFNINIVYFEYIIINLLILMISSVLLQLLRGLSMTLEYSIASIIAAVSMLVSNLILILVFHFQAESILISSSIANLLCIIYIVFKTKIFRYIKRDKVNKKKIKELLRYSLPMIPNSISWWIINVSDRTIISYFLDVAYNGIYAISCKFSNLLNSVFLVFNMSWQETATLHINDSDKDEFFSKMVNAILILFLSISLCIIAVLPFFYDLLIGNDYISSYNYIPILLYANNWNILIGLLGGIYIAKKKTKQIMNTTIASAVINIVIHIILIKYIGLYAACVSTLISYMSLGIYRYLDCQKYVKVKINYKKMILFSIVFAVETLIYIKNNVFLNAVGLLSILAFSTFMNKSTLKYLYKLIIMKFKSLNKKTV